MTFDPAKFKALVHYICHSVRDKDKLGRVKLHKVLWLAEGQHFLMYAEPIAGETYKKMPYGPFATHLDDTIRAMESEGRLVVRQVEFRGTEKFEFYAQGAPEGELFSEAELRMIDRFIRDVCEDHTAVSISDRTHGPIWEMAAMYEPLPIETFLVQRLIPPNEDDFAWARNHVANTR